MCGGDACDGDYCGTSGDMLVFVSGAERADVRRPAKKYDCDNSGLFCDVFEPSHVESAGIF